MRADKGLLLWDKAGSKQREILRDDVTKGVFEIAVAETGDDALPLVNAVKPDPVLRDRMLPDVSRF